jgi:hypothetical protein
MGDDGLLSITDHARKRFAQRNLSADDVQFCVEYGTHLHRTGVTFVVLRGRDIPPRWRRLDRYARLEGAVLVIDGARVVTAYRSRTALPRLRKKMKYSEHMCA